MQKILSVFYLLSALLFLIFPDLAGNSAEKSLLVIKNVVLSSLFPMMVLTRLISSSNVSYGAIKKLAKSKIWRALSLSDALVGPVISGILSGFPASAREIERLKKEGVITPDEAEKALALSSAPSPAFVIGVVGMGFFEGALLFSISLTVSYLVAKSKKSVKSHSATVASRKALPEAISSSVSSALVVSGNIIFFGFLIALFSFLGEKVTLVVASFTELGAGYAMLSEKPALLALLVGFGGLSALCQIKAESPSVSTALYLKARVITALLLFLLRCSYKIF